MRETKYSNRVSLLLIIGSFTLVESVKINNLHVPEVIRHRAAVVLDCDFTVEESDQDLVVKWFFNSNNQTLVYQWIPASSSRPQVLGILKDRLNLEYAVSAVDNNGKHRALHILDAGPDLSGNYTCSVSTLQSEDIRTKSMLVFDPFPSDNISEIPERLLIIRRLHSSVGLMRIQCTAEGVFPSPEILLRSHKRELIETEITSEQRGNLYDISVSATLKALEEPEEFSCELRIPQANYTVRKETVIYPGNKGFQITHDIWITILSCVPILCQRIFQILC